MIKLLGGSGAKAIAVAVVVIVGAVVWFQFGRETTPVALPETPQEVSPQQAALPAETPKIEVETAAKTEPAAPQPESENTEQASAEADNAAPEQTAAEPAVETAEAADTPAPSFDEVRQEIDGMTVIAGRAAPGAVVKIMQDGQEIALATADRQGKFAAVTLIAPDGQGHVLSLLQIDGDETLDSADQIILAPIAPIQIAEAEPVAEQTTADTVEVPETSDVTTQSETTALASADVAAVETPVTDESPQNTEETPQNTQEGAAAETEMAQSSDPVVKPVTPQGEPNVAAAQPQEPASQEVAVLRTTDQGVELLNAPRPEAMENVALDTISYSDAGDVQLAGRAQADTRTVRVYLDNNAIISLPVDDAGRWRGDIPDVDEGIYTLRVDEVAQDGAVTSRVETPFKREDPEVLAQAAGSDAAPLKQITVQKGATLWAIAQERYGDGLLYVNVFKANAANIRDPDLIYPGQIFDLPEN